MEQQDTGDFLLSVTYKNPSDEAWQHIETRLGEIKRYETADICLKDISRVQRSARLLPSLAKQRTKKQG